MTREAIILCGGMGSRLKKVVNDRPKPMALINNKPFLHYLLNYLQKENFSHIILSVGFKHELISNYFGKLFKGIKISYAIEKEPLGTGGGILNALHLTTGQQAFIFNGDTYFPVSVEKMEKTAVEKKCDLVIALRKLNKASRYGTILMNDQGRITQFTEKNIRQGPTLINGGIYLINRQTFSKIPFPAKFSFENDYLAKFYQKQHFCGNVFDHYFLDIGIPSSYQQAQTDFLNFEDK
ncbi:MAG: nucleotidyltransferase family protein [Prolixibacteraceae bacterium]|nr:nucleotidyltransferase family protein [Prolixibacteraceae bacterium]